MEDIESYLQQFDPFRDENEEVTEESHDYVKRMQAGPLPNWPDKPLIEWLHRHAQCIDRYAKLKYERFQFQRQHWLLDQIPGCEAFDKKYFYDNFRDIKLRAENPKDWLAHFMLENGTWNTPIVLLDNENNRYGLKIGETLKQPYHLLEGHGRLSFLNGLRDLECAKPGHDVWLVNLTKTDQ